MQSNDDAFNLQQEGITVSEQKDKEAKILAKKPVNNSKEKVAKMEHRPKAVDITNSPSKTSEKDSIVHCHPEMKALNQTPKKKESDSDGKELHEEEEYFDDSTEERFYKQSSMSEDSDSGDDFFIGKVRRTRKKESSCQSSVLEQKSTKKVFPEEEVLKTHLGIRNDKNKPSTEVRKFESVFFHSLSGCKSSRR